jgi:hypothetical protein
MEQLIEATNPILIQTGNLAIEDGVLHWAVWLELS